MKSKAQKQEELKKGAELLGKSEVLIFTDIGKVPTESIRQLRRELKNINSSLFVIKKRLLNVLFKQKGVETDTKQFHASIGTVFAGTSLENASAPVFKFFSSLSPAAAREKILGAYDLKNKKFIESQDVIFIGQLPPREVLLSQLLGQLSAPIQSLLYILSERGKKVGT